jgi:uncharacterized protein (DUF2384 family)
VDAILTPEERLSRVDQEIDELKNALAEALAELEEAPEVDPSALEERWQAVSERLLALRGEVDPRDLDKEQVTQFFNALLNIRGLVDRDGPPYDLDTCEAMLVEIERIRHVVRDALDEHVSGIREDAGLILEDLDKWLPNTPDRVIAELVGVDRRTLARWKAQPGVSPRRPLRVLARLVAILRHNWTEDGIIDWLNRPRRDLDGKRPAALLDAPNREHALVDAARSSRSGYGS